MWIPFILISALLLALYDTAKKHSVRDNGVMPVLFLATACGALTFVMALAAGGQLCAALTISRSGFWLVALKSLIVSASWVFVYYAMRALPLSIAAPIRASAPLWTLIGAIALFHEIPTPTQAAGMAAILAGYWLFSAAGKAEGIRFTRHIGVFYAFAGTLLGAGSALYDKYLLRSCGLARNTLQLWFAFDLVVILGLGLIAQRAAGLQRTRFTWRWTIPVVGILLMAADWFYFGALSEDGVAISVLSLIRRSNVVLSFAAGVLLFHERNVRKKGVALIAVLAGVALLCLG
ncbi:MAG TPA: EamA family transporter [Kiritimatiellia bacterium]|nr:EamA family transporter [Kiritimatiellia bacterium]HPS07623.1 EamA family transporter [Kiritimatiellia bacterium]